MRLSDNESIPTMRLSDKCNNNNITLFKEGTDNEKRMWIDNEKQMWIDYLKS